MESICAGCGHAWPRPFFSGRYRVTRCLHCPPLPPSQPAPDLSTQLESLLDEIWRDEKRERLQDRLDLMEGQNR